MLKIKVKDSENSVDNLEYVEPEIWKDVPGYNGDYKVSNYGRVKSFKNNSPRILKQHKGCSNRCRVDLVKPGHRKNYKVHRLVGEAFIPNPENKPQINHKDGDQSNNHVDNLEWVTNQENRDHAVESGLHPVGEPCSKAGLTNNDIVQMRNTYKMGCFSYREIGEAWEISTKQAWNIINKRQWGHV